MYTGTEPIWFPMQFEIMRNFKKILWYTQEKERKRKNPAPSKPPMLMYSTTCLLKSSYLTLKFYDFSQKPQQYTIPSPPQLTFIYLSHLCSFPSFQHHFSQCLFPVGNLVCFGGKTTVPGKMDSGASDFSLGGSCMCLVCIVRRDPWGRACNDPLCGTL